MATQTLTDKLDPSRFPGMSGQMGAILGCILSETFVSPKITGLIITSDGYLMASIEGDIGYNHILGNENDLQSNWDNLLDKAGLTDDEKAAANELKDLTIRRA